MVSMKRTYKKPLLLNCSMLLQQVFPSVGRPVTVIGPVGAYLVTRMMKAEPVSRLKNI